MENTEKNDCPSRKSGVKFSKKIFAVRKRVREGRGVEREEENKVNSQIFKFFSSMFFFLCAFVWRGCLTVIIEDAFGFLIIGYRNDCSYEYVHYGHQQDNE